LVKGLWVRLLVVVADVEMQRVLRAVDVLVVFRVSLQMFSGAERNMGIKE
jgi:hypothetical protein